MKRVIDADNLITLEHFKEIDTDIIKGKYELMSKYNDVSIDVDGDIILWKE